MKKYQQKLQYTLLDTQYDETDGKNVQVEKLVYQEYGEVLASSPFMVVNGVQVDELDVTHIIETRYSPKVTAQMKVHRLFRNPDRSVMRETFRIIRILPMNQDNRYMKIYVSSENIQVY